MSIRAIGFVLTLLIVRLIIKLIYSNTELYKLIANEKVNLLNNSNVTTAIIFALIGFGLYNKDQLLKIKKYVVKNRYFYFALSFVFLLTHYILRYFTTQSESLIIGIVRVIFLLGFGGYLFLGFFGVELVKKFKKELIVFSIIGVFYYFFTSYFQLTWIFFSSIISRLLFLFFSLFYEKVYLQPQDDINAIIQGGGPIVGLEDFLAKIGPPCSGVDSLLLFISTFILIISLEYKNINKKWILPLFIIGILGMFITNLIRLIMLFFIGNYISKTFAVGLFHANIGWVLFIVYGLAFWFIASKFIFIKKGRKWKKK